MTPRSGVVEGNWRQSQLLPQQFNHFIQLGNSAKRGTGSSLQDQGARESQ